MHGTGPFVPADINLSVHAIYDANPNYFREGLPLIDRYKNVIIKDLGTRFTALATGNIHFYGEGSYGFTSGQAEQALRDFDDTIEVNVQLNHWARGNQDERYPAPVRQLAGEESGSPGPKSGGVGRLQAG